jgi:hypothetical protein
VWREEPAAVLCRTEECGEAGIGVEARPTEPIDGAVASDERSGLQIADHRVIFYSSSHSLS